MVQRRLGRGLDFLLSGGEKPAANGGGDEVAMVELSRLEASPYQPRQDFPESELEELAASIRATGVLQPILVRKVGDRLELIAGERRWRAAQLAGLERIPALVRDVSDQSAAVFGLVENLQRADLNAIEKAKAFAKLQKMMGGTQEEVAKQVGLSRAAVANFQRLLDLPEEIQAHVSRGTLTMGHARALLALRNADEQRKVAEEIIRSRLSVRQVEALVQELSGATPRDGDRSGRSGDGAPQSAKREPWLIEIEDTISTVLDAKVAVRYTEKRSRIMIECEGRAEFERVYDLLRGMRD